MNKWKRIRRKIEAKMIALGVFIAFIPTAIIWVGVAIGVNIICGILGIMNWIADVMGEGIEETHHWVEEMLERIKEKVEELEEDG